MQRSLLAESDAALSPHTTTSAGRAAFSHPKYRPDIDGLRAVDRLHAGTECTGFHGWENGLGEPAGDHLEEVRHELEILLASTPCQTRIITAADFDPDAFDRIWKSAAVQEAGKHFGWRGAA